MLLSAEEDKVAKSNKAAEGVKTVKVERDLRVAAAAATFASLRAAAQAKETRVSVDARQVEKVDAAGLQAVLAGCRLLAGAGKEVRWAGCSAQFTTAAELLGLSEPLGIRP